MTCFIARQKHEPNLELWQNQNDEHQVLQIREGVWAGCQNSSLMRASKCSRIHEIHLLQGHIFLKPPITEAIWDLHVLALAPGAVAISSHLTPLKVIYHVYCCRTCELSSVYLYSGCYVLQKRFLKMLPFINVVDPLGAPHALCAAMGPMATVHIWKLIFSGCWFKIIIACQNMNLSR
jgi:hypothetical protein